MIEGWHDAACRYSRRNRGKVVLAVAALVAAGAAGLTLIRFDGNIELMLPRHAAVLRNLDFLRTSNVSGKVVISVKAASPKATLAELLRAVDRLARSLDPALFPEVVTGVSAKDIGGRLEAIRRLLPAVATPDDLAAIDGMLTREAVAAKLRENYRRMLAPGGMFADASLRSDPLGMTSIVLARLKAATDALGFRVEIRDGHFVSADGRHALIIASTPVAVTDAEGSRRILDHLESRLAGLPEWAGADVACGHAHTVSNEDVMKRDIRLTMAIAAVAFPVLLVAAIGDIGAALVFVIPLLAIVLAVNLAYLLVGTLSYAVMGMGAVVAGISVDYGIHVYVALRARRGGRRAGGRPAREAAVREVTGPVTASALTTAGMFLAFFFSRIEGYHQMALFAILSILLSLACALFVLPHVLRERRPGGLIAAMEGAGWSSGAAVAGWAAVTAALVACATRIEFQSSMAAIDGTAPAILRAEERLGEVWGKKDLAVVVVEAKERDDALRVNEDLFPRMREVVDQRSLATIAGLDPVPETRRRNVARWREFWRGSREENLRRLLGEEGARAGYAEDAFEPFLAGLHSDPAGAPFSELRERFVQETPAGTRVMSFFPDRADLVRRMEAAAGDRAYVVSRNAFADTVARVVWEDMRRMTAATVLFVAGITFLFLRNLKATGIALVPAVTSVAWLLGFLALLGLPLNVANLVANLVVMGLCVDYGIFMTYRSRYGLRTGTVRAVTLSALSTLVGAGVLLFARHPALFSIGLTIMVGVTAGYIASVLAVPRLCAMAGLDLRR